MKLFYGLFSTALATLTMAATSYNAPPERDTVPTIYLAGDSTMTLQDNKAIQGWGVYLPYSLKGVKVVNDAVSGRSARSFTVEGRFTAIANAVVPGDFVIIEFGHNDGGSPDADNGRGDCPGSGSQTCTTSTGLVVQTYVTYLTNAANLMIAKGAHVIVASQTPQNPYENRTTFSYTPTVFTDYCKIVVRNAGNASTFIDHGQYGANRYKALGKTVVDTFFPLDHTHTSPAGADVIAGAFVRALLCDNNPLAAYVKNATDTVAGTCI